MDPSWVRISCWSILQLHPWHPLCPIKTTRSRSWWASIPKSPKISRRSSTRISLSRAWHQCLGIGFSMKFGDFPGHKPGFGVGFSTFHGGFSTYWIPHWNLQRSSNRLRFGWQSMAIQRCFCGRWSLRCLVFFRHLPLWKMMEWKSVGRMIFPYMKWKVIKFMFETTNQCLYMFQPIWKIVSWDHSQYMESHKSHVPNHQPDI